MKNQKVISRFFISICFIPYVLILFFSFYTSWHNYEMLEKMERENLHTFIINTSRLKWVKKNKEISIDGALFDVKKITISEGYTIITGLFDYEETKFENIINNLTDHQQNKETTTSINAIFSLFVAFKAKIKFPLPLSICCLEQQSLKVIGSYKEPNLIPEEYPPNS